MTVLVTGGRGAIARGVVAGLEAAGEDVRVGGREPAALGTGAVLVDLGRPETLPAALDGVDRVLLYAHPEGVAGFVAAAQAAGVRQVVVVSSLTVAAPRGGGIADRHRLVEEAVAAGGFATTFLRPGTFAGNARQYLPGIASGEVRLPYPDAGTAPIDERDIADVAVVVLRAGPASAHDGTAPALTGPASLTRREEVEQLAAALRREVRIVPIDAAAARDELAGRMPAHVVESLLDLWAEADGRPAAVSDAVERITGRPGRTFATWAEEVAVPLAVR